MALDDSDEESFTLIDQTGIVSSFAQREIPPKSIRWGEILIGQIASVTLCLSGVATIFLTDYGMASPLVQNWLAYFLVSLVFTTALAFNPSISSGSADSDFLELCKSRGWKYFFLAIVDAGAAYFLVMAYQFTSLTSVQLLDCVTIPTTLVLSYIFLSTRYGYFHYVGIVLSLLGAGFLVWADLEAGIGIDGVDPITGDILTLIGAVLFGISNVCQEYFCKSYSPYEYLGFTGFFGCVLSGIFALATVEFSLLRWTWLSITILVGFALSKFFFYLSVAYLMVESNSVAINLAVLSAGFYAIIVGTYLFGYEFNALYIISFILVIGGVGLFSLRPISSAVLKSET